MVQINIFFLLFYGISADNGGGSDGTTTFASTECIGVACAFHLCLSPLSTCYSFSSGPFSIGCDGFIDNLKFFTLAGSKFV